jgi:hypothetical protein
MPEIPLPIPIGMGVQFNAILGMFHQNWSAIDLHTDFAIYRFLKVTPLQAHMIVSGMMFGRKARLLADLIRNSDAPNKAQLLGPFNRIRAAKRDVIAHSHFTSDALGVAFLERSVSADFKATVHQYTFAEFQRHVDEVAVTAREFVEAIGATPEEIDTFVKAALSLERKSIKSPESPTSSK